MKDSKQKSGRYSGSMSPPPESFSRSLNEMVAAQELPYGYTSAPPPAGHENAETIQNQKLQRKGRYGY